MAADSSSIAGGLDPVGAASNQGAAGSPDQCSSTSRSMAILGYGIAALAIAIGWLGREERHIVAGSGLGYWLGIAGASMMAVLLLYPVRKHVRFMHRFGSTKAWFQMHVFLGVLGPISVLYHCNFQLGPLNSRVALICTLLVAISGLAGRYLYAKVHLGLSGSRADLQQLVEQARLTSQQKHYASAFVPELLERMNRYDRKVLEPPQGFLASALLPMRLALVAPWARLRLTLFARRQLRIQAKTNGRTRAERRRFEHVLQKFISEHLRRVRRVATFSFYERTFSLWHIFHLPFFYILVFATLVHILAVHMY